MDVRITDLKAKLSDNFKNLAEKKLARFDRIFGGGTTANVKVSVEKNAERVEITIHHNGRVYRTESVSEDINKSLDLSLDLLHRKLEKNKTKLERSFRDNLDDVGFYEEDEPEVDEPYKIIKRKVFTVKPMSIEEAILQMNLVGHQFFMFRSQDTNEINVVYKRKNNTYGLLEPEN